MKTISQQIRSFIWMALREDIGAGDVTTDTFVPSQLIGKAKIVSKADGILCGGVVVKEVFRRIDPRLRVIQKLKDARRIHKGRVAFELHGRIASILKGERLALNFLNHLSGIATLTDRFVQKTKGTRAQIFDTRKTTPLWRELEKYAVRCGGGHNHRFGLWDEILVKDNHWEAMRDLLEKTKCRYFGKKLKVLRKHKRIPVQVEVKNLKQLAHLFEGGLGIDRVLLDNFSVPELKRAVSMVKRIASEKWRRRTLVLEASGGITLKNVRQVAKTGIDRISVGALTHSAPALDFSLDVSLVAPRARRLRKK